MSSSSPTASALLIVEADIADPRSCQGPALLETELRSWQARYLDAFAGPKARWTAAGMLQVIRPEEGDVQAGPRQSPDAVDRVARHLASHWPGLPVELHAPFESLALFRQSFARHGLPLTVPTAGKSIGERISWLRQQVR
jgi:hypothetical protein